MDVFYNAKEKYITHKMGHFPILLCEEIIFSLHKGKNYGLRYEVIIFSRVRWKYHFFTPKVEKMQFPLSNYQIIHIFQEGFAFISFKYLHFFVLLEIFEQKEWNSSQSDIIQFKSIEIHDLPNLERKNNNFWLTHFKPNS